MLTLNRIVFIMRWLPNGHNPLQPGDHRVVVAADEQLPVIVPAAHNAHVGVLRVKTPGRRIEHPPRQ